VAIETAETLLERESELAELEDALGALSVLRRRVA
jgi:hypothetical protein